MKRDSSKINLKYVIEWMSNEAHNLSYCHCCLLHENNTLKMRSHSWLCAMLLYIATMSWKYISNASTWTYAPDSSDFLKIFSKKRIFFIQIKSIMNGTALSSFRNIIFACQIPWIEKIQFECKKEREKKTKAKKSKKRNKKKFQLSNVSYFAYSNINSFRLASHVYVCSCINNHFPF